MLPVVVLALSLMTAAFALPVTPEGQLATEAQRVPQTHQEIPNRQVEKTGYQGSSESYAPAEQNAALPKVENVPVRVENVQSSSADNPVLLPIQPLSVIPVNPTGQVVRPIIVPAEAIATGRVIIMAIDPIQQRSLQDVVPVPEKQVPQIIQPLIYTPIQTQVTEPNQNYVQQVEKQTPVQQIQAQPNEEPLNREQTVQRVENYNPVPQVYNVQPNVQPENQVPYQSQVAEPVVQQHQIQKQVPYQQATPNQSQEPQYQQVHSDRPTPYENVEKLGQQVYNEQEQRQLHQVSTYTPAQNQPLEQVYNVQPTQEQLHDVQSVEQQVYNVQPVNQDYSVQQVTSEKQEYDQVQAQSVELQQQQAESVRQAVQEQVAHQQPVQTHPPESVYQQIYNAVLGGYQQAAAQVPEQAPKTGEVGQHHHVESYAAQPPYNYGDKLPQVQQYNPANAQSYSVQPSNVVSAHE